MKSTARPCASSGRPCLFFWSPWKHPWGGRRPAIPWPLSRGTAGSGPTPCSPTSSPCWNLNPEPLLEINPQDAAERGIAEGDLATVFNDRGRATLRARVTEAVGSRVVNITQGWWIDQFREGSVNHLTHDVLNPVQAAVYEPNMHMNDVAVEVVRAREGSE